MLYGGGKLAFAATAFPVTKNGITYDLYSTEALHYLQGCVSVCGFVPDELVDGDGNKDSTKVIIPETVTIDGTTYTVKGVDIEGSDRRTHQENDVTAIQQHAQHH